MKNSAIWHPGNLEEGTLPHEMVIVYRTGYAGYQVTDEGELKELFFYPLTSPCTAAAWDPLHTHLLAIAEDCDVKVINISDNSVHAEMKRACGHHPVHGVQSEPSQHAVHGWQGRRGYRVACVASRLGRGKDAPGAYALVEERVWGHE